MFVGFGETDEWAHAGRYDHYLTAAHHVDEFIGRLWQTAQSLPKYRGQTTFLITADHGRGAGPSDWKDHGAKVVGAEGDWLAVIGPDTPPLGERTNIEAHTQAQIAATIAALIGEDYQAAFPKSGKAISEILRANH
jgi:bisphosphoglycerate-independent phosphoglycerate mutase (AlkP superfamily)